MAPKNIKQWLHENCKKYKKKLKECCLFEVGRETLALIKTINNVATYFLRSNSFPFTRTENINKFKKKEKYKQIRILKTKTKNS